MSVQDDNVEALNDSELISGSSGQSYPSMGYFPGMMSFISFKKVARPRHPASGKQSEIDE